MATATTQTLTPEMLQNRALKAQTDAYVQNQKRADFNRNLAQYMFWGATTVMAGLVAAAVGLGGAKLGSLAIFGLGAGVSVTLIASVAGAALLGSLMFSRRATEIQEKGSVLYSDIDSKHQAHRMVQAFARAQSQGEVATDNSAPMTSKTSWAERTGGPKQQAGDWQARIAAQALREDVQTLRQLG